MDYLISILSSLRCTLKKSFLQDFLPVLLAYPIFSILIANLCFFNSQLYAEETNPSRSEEGYAWPVQGIRAITGTFGEYRNTHFHMGMDFSTGGKRGIPILSVSDGKIIKVQRYWTSIGYSVIVEHEDGMQARYGHLSRYSNRLVKNLNASKMAKTFKSRKDFQYNLDKPIPVKKGEIIAYSGDTGVGPPHLHFELFKNGVYYNPSQFGIGAEDGEEIVFDFIQFNPETSRTFINGKHEPLKLKLIKEGSTYRIDSEETEIRLQGLVSIQLSGHQKSKNNRLGLGFISMVLNGTKILDLNFQEIPKNQTKKFVLVYDAYKSKTNGDPFLYKLFSRDGNGIPGLGATMTGSGLISSGSLNQSIPNEIVILAGGLGNHTSEIYINPIKDSGDYSHIKTPSFVYNVKKSEYTSLASQDKSIELFFPAHSVFSHAKFDIEEWNGNHPETPGLTLESKIFKISPEEFREFNLGYDLYVKLGYNTDLKKCGLFELTKSGKIRPVVGAALSPWGRFFKVRMKRTGTFLVLKDDIAPSLEIMDGLENGHEFSGSQFEIRWKLEDMGTGFDTNAISVLVDGQPGFAEVNIHKGIATIVEPQSMFDPGSHKMEITAIDKVGNVSEKKVFDYKVLGTKVASHKNPLSKTDL